MRVNLRGPDGNAHVVMGHATRMMRAMGRPQEEIDAVMEDAMSSDYQHLLDVCAREAGLVYTGRKRAAG